jgi:1-acyl-sn-glycerol-3-phosphate acyltransferase
MARELQKTRFPIGPKKPQDVRRNLFVTVQHGQTAAKGATMTANRIAPVLRHWMWRVVSSFSCGLTVTGKWRSPGGCIVVANHSSHADTAVLLAALPPEAKPVFGAAADYWFDVPVRRFIATSLAGVLPVGRSGDGSYTALLAAVRPALKA